MICKENMSFDDSCLALPFGASELLTLFALSALFAVHLILTKPMASCILECERSQCIPWVHSSGKPGLVVFVHWYCGH